MILQNVWLPFSELTVSMCAHISPSQSNLYSRRVVCGPCQTGTISSSRSWPSPLVSSGSLRSAETSAAGPCSWSLRDPETPRGPGGQSSETGKGAGCTAGGPSDDKNVIVWVMILSISVWPEKICSAFSSTYSVSTLPCPDPTLKSSLLQSSRAGCVKISQI